MNAAQEGWNARQPEIDALKAERDAHRDNAQCLVEENAALKAEAEKWKRLLEDRAVSKYNFETTVERETMKEPK
jgi:regulator of replication initiation timing